MAAVSPRPPQGGERLRRPRPARATAPPGLWQAVVAAVLSPILLPACADELPDDVATYREDCIRMNASPLPRRRDDPHEGEKDVFACNVSLEQLRSNQRPFPDGAVLVKESTQADLGYPWLVATARKRGNTWRWNEYSRNFADESFLEIAAGESVCIDCHRRVRSSDWIYTAYQND